MSDQSEKSVAPVSESRPRRWDPLSMFAELESDLDRMFGRRLPFMQPLRRYTGSLAGGWAPSSDIYQKDDKIVVKAELPGVAKEDIDISIENGNLVVKGVRKAEEEVKEEDYYCSERFSGSFYRSFPMPDGVKADTIDAEFKDGALEVRVPKPQTTESESTKVSIH